MFGAYDLNETM